MMNFRFEKYSGLQSENARKLAVAMRKEDWEECRIVGMPDGYIGLVHSLAESTEAFFVMVGDEPIGAFGAVRYEATKGACVWFVGSPEIEKHKLQFVKWSRSVAENLVAKYGLIYNVVPTSYPKALRWVESFGGELGEKFSINGVEVQGWTMEKARG